MEKTRNNANVDPRTRRLAFCALFTALGVVLGGIYLVTGNLWLAILAHVINNGMLVVQSYLFQHGLSGTDPMVDDFLPWYFAVISLAVTAGLFWALIKRSPDPIQVETYPMDDHTASQ